MLGLLALVYFHALSGVLSIEHLEVISFEVAGSSEFWSNSSQGTCDKDNPILSLMQNNKPVNGIYNSNQLDVSRQLSPFWRIQYRIDLVIPSFGAQPIQFILQLNNQIYSSTSVTPVAFASNICGPNYGSIITISEFISQNIPTNDLKLSINSVLPTVFSLHNFLLFLDLCHFSCLKCFGPSENDCTTCKQNFRMQLGKCVLEGSLSAEQINSICQSGFMYLNGNCVENYCNPLVCSQCGTSNQCLTCVSNYLLSEGKCVLFCPPYSSIVNTNCQPNPISIGSNTNPSTSNTLISNAPIVYYSALNSQYFGESHIESSGLIVSGFNQVGGQFIRNTKTSLFNGKSYLGGSFIAGKNSAVQLSLRNLKAHFQVEISLNLILIDDWTYHMFIIEFINVAKYLISFDSSQASSSSELGLQEFNESIQVATFAITNNLSSYDIKIYSDLPRDKSASFALRDLYIRITYCPDNCLVCNSEKCLSCNNITSLSLGQCVASCPSGELALNNICETCSDHCLTCVNSRFNCTSCDASLILFNNQCLETCPEGYLQGQNPICFQCNPSCKTCAQGSPGVCLSCSGNLGLLNGQCLANGGIGYYRESNTFLQCNIACRVCTGPNFYECSECNNGFYLQPNSQRCINLCEPPFFGDSVTNTCQPCIQSCFICTNRLTCITCFQNYQIFNNICVSACPPGTFPNPDPMSSNCLECDSTCETCNGASPLNCLTCNSDRFLNNTQCVTECPTNTVLINRVCVPCEFPCATCSGLAYRCTSCLGNQFLNPDAFRCLPRCPDEYFAEGRTCVRCPIECSACRNANLCLLCAEGFVLHEQSCILECPVGYYQQYGQCFPCFERCRRCQSQHPQDCDECVPNYLYYPQLRECLTECKTRYVNQNGICVPCHISCNECTGGGSNDCTSCAPNYFLNPDNSCTLKCPETYFPNIETQQCTPCPPECLSCSALDQCQTCKPGQQQYYNQCVNQCPPGTYLSNSDCVQCDQRCLTCVNSSTNCTSCPPHKIFYQNDCLDQCPYGYFPGTNPPCYKCSGNCYTCTQEAPDVCLSCTGAYSLLNGRCVTDCGARNYAQSNVCQPCHPNCRTCTGPNQGDCKSCEIGFYLQPDLRTCNPGCPDGYFPNASLNTCENCPVHCRTCTDQNTCTSCDVLMELVNGKCKSSCPPGTFPNFELVICENCKIGCELCTSRVDCSKCTELILHQNNCIEQCPPGTYETNSPIRTCNTCHQNCLSCTGPLETDCTAKQSIMRGMAILGVVKGSLIVVAVIAAVYVDQRTTSANYSKVSSGQKIGTSEIIPIKLGFSDFFNNQLFDEVENEEASGQKGRSVWWFILVGNEWVSAFYFNDKDFMRVNRVFLIQIKYYAFFIVTYFEVDTMTTVILPLLGGWIAKFVFGIIFQIRFTERHIILNQVGITIFFMLTIALVMVVIGYSNIFIDSTKWMIYYIIVFAADLLICQQVFSYFEYLIAKKMLRKYSLREISDNWFRRSITNKYFQKCSVIKDE